MSGKPERVPDAGSANWIGPELETTSNTPAWIADPWLAYVGDTRVCPDCGRPQHYTGTEHGWAHDAGYALLACGASPALTTELEK